MVFTNTNEYVDIMGYDGLYMISKSGILVSKKRGIIKRLKAYITKSGYKRFKLVNHIGLHKNHYLHKLLAIAFIINPNNKKEVNHIDGNKLNNKISNLEWVSPSENMLHAYKLCLIPKTKKNSTLKEYQVVEIIKKFIPRIYTKQMLANEYGVSIGCIEHIFQRESWKHVYDKLRRSEAG